MWKSECEKEEKKSLDKWRYKEIWLLDYVRRYGNNVTKEKESKQNRKNSHKRDKPQTQKNNTGNAGDKGQSKSQNNTGNARDKGQYKTSSRMPTTTDSHYTATSSEETVPLKDIAYHRKNQSHSNTFERKQPWNQQRNRTDHRRSRNENITENIPVHRNKERNGRRYFHGSNNVCNINGTTYIGRNASHHFLGGGKPSQGERFRYNRPYHQQRQ